VPVEGGIGFFENGKPIEQAESVKGLNMHQGKVILAVVGPATTSSPVGWHSDAFFGGF
jgi:hypothetical protein